MLSFRQYLQEQLTKGTIWQGNSWYHPTIGHINTGFAQTHNGQTTEPATYHIGFVARNPHIFGLTPEDMMQKIEEHDPESYGKEVLADLQSGAQDVHPPLARHLFNQGWVRVSASGKTLYTEGSQRGLLGFAKHVRDRYPDIQALNMDVRGERSRSHALNSMEEIDHWISQGGNPGLRSRMIPS